MQESAPDHLNLLAPDGIVRVTFATAPNTRTAIVRSSCPMAFPTTKREERSILASGVGLRLQ
jgi:hypothetical protein